MAIATFSQFTLAQPITKENLVASLENAFNAVQFGTEIFKVTDLTIDPYRNVRRIVLDSTKTRGFIDLRIRVTNALVIGLRSYSYYDEPSATYLDAGNEVTSPTISGTVNITFHLINAGLEFKAIILTQGSTIFPIAYLAPANKPNWWDLNVWNYGFIATINTFVTFTSTTLNPYANVLYDSNLNNSRLATANPQTSKRDIQLGFNLFAQSNQGMAGQTSEDLVSVAASGTARFDAINLIDGKQYLIINNVAGGLGCRTI